MINLGIFTIFTNIYKDYFDNFVNSLNLFFPGEKKELCILSDGLKDKNDIFIGDVHVIVNEIIDLPYPYINMNKFQFINEYNKKMNFDYIAYFDADTIFFEKDTKFWQILKDEIKTNKIVISRHPFFTDAQVNTIVHNMTNFMMVGDPYVYDRPIRNHDDLTYTNGKFIDENKTWLITSFFIINKELLNNYAEKIKKLIRKCNVEFALMLKFSDESHFNLMYYFDYLNNEVENKYVIKDYITIRKDVPIENDSQMFLCQKYNMESKSLTKFSKNKNAVILVIDNDFDETFLYKLYSKYIYDFNFIAISKVSDEIIRSYVFNRYMWQTYTQFYDEWFGDKNIFFNKKFYNEYLENRFDNYLIVSKYDESVFNIDANKLIENNIEYKSDKSIKENQDYNNLSYMFCSHEFIEKHCIYDD